MPGIVEEVLLAIQRQQPLYIAGGFGGAAHIVADVIEGKKPPNLSRSFQERIGQPYIETFRFYEERRKQSSDVQLPDMDGFEVACALIDGGHGLVIVMTSSRDAAAYAEDIERIGVPFVGKAELSGSAIRSALGGVR